MGSHTKRGTRDEQIVLFFSVRGRMTRQFSLLPVLVVFGILGAGAQLGSKQEGLLGEEERALATWGVNQLAGTKGACARTIQRVNSYHKQVVAGNLHHFGLVLEHPSSNPVDCKVATGSQESCTIVVFEQSWTKTKEVNWERSTCSRD